MYIVPVLSLILGASALTVPRSSCSFGLTASGGQSGTIGQLSDGQNRIGGGLTASTYTILNGGITDSAGYGCILTPSVEQFQCDQGVGPTYGFTIESNAALTYNGSSVFYACPASETEWNLYTTPVVGQLKCVEISLTASGCAAATSSSQSVTTVTVYECGTASSTVPATISSESPSSPAVIESSTPTVTVETPSIVPTSSPISTVVESSISTPSVEATWTAEASTSTSVELSTAVPTSTTVTLSELSTTPISTESPAAVPTSVAPSPIESSTTSVVISSSTSTPLAESPTSVTVWATAATSTPSTFSVAASPSTTALQSPSEVSYSSTTTPSSSSVAASSSCVATSLTGSSTSGNYQYPHLIIPVSSSTPTTAEGTQYFATISSNTSTIFNFDIPSTYSGSTCNLIFLLPLHSELETSSYTSSGSGEIEFQQLSSAATGSTTYDNAPAVASELGDFTITEGSSTLISSFSCPAGETVTYELKAVGDTYMYYFQDWNPSPLGLYITYC